MNQDYCIDGRHFRTKEEYLKGLKDKTKIDKIKNRLPEGDVEKARGVLQLIRTGKIRFETILGRDFTEELEDICDDVRKSPQRKKQNIPNESRRINRKDPKKETINEKKPVDPKLEQAVQRELLKMKRRRRYLQLGCAAVAALFLALFGLHYFFQNRTQSSYEQYDQLKEKSEEKYYLGDETSNVKVNKTEPVKEKEILPEYNDLIKINKKLIGWLKIDDTNIDYPVVQASDNEFYLKHNFEDEYDKNGTIFMDKDCDVLQPSTNFILYGHRMQSGAMFGKLSKYEDADYCRKHQYIEFDTIYEKGIYQVMYVFRSTILNSDDVEFKYYQFIDANSEQEFQSNMEQMAAISLVDTKVTAEYGDRLLTLSTCDYYETNGRFVVVAKKVPAKE